MNKQELEEMNKAQVAYSALCNKHYAEVMDIGRNIKDRVLAAYNLLYPPPKTHRIQFAHNSYHRWFQPYCDVRVNFEDGIFVEYWECGSFGDNGRMLKSIMITEDLLTNDLVDEYVNAWIRDEKTAHAAALASLESDRQKKIAELKAELQQLEGKTK